MLQPKQSVVEGNLLQVVEGTATCATGLFVLYIYDFIIKLPNR